MILLVQGDHSQFEDTVAVMVSEGQFDAAIFLGLEVALLWAAGEGFGIALESCFDVFWLGAG